MIRKHRPWAWSQISADPDTVDLPQHTGGRCERGEHHHCPQLPGPAPDEPGTCGCPCHREGQMELDLFSGAIPDPEPQPDPYKGMGQDARRTAKRRELLAAGIHPATKVRLSDAHAGKTCGDCAHLWRKAVNRFAGWKCDRAASNGLHGPDMRKSWPACTLFEEASK